MNSSPHIEKHFTSGDTIRDIVIGMADGLTVPFALAAGLSGAVLGNSIIVTAGLAEIVAGSIAMGLGGYLAARSDAEHYANELQREYDEVATVPDKERQEVVEIFENYGLTAEEVAPVVEALSRHPKAWVGFMMRFELGLEKPEPGRAWKSALAIAISYIVGGLFPLAPYILLKSQPEALRLSVILTLFALIVFGYVKGRFTGARPWRSAAQTALIGGTAAAAAFGLAKAFGG